jgi:hypothetical protein
MLNNDCHGNLKLTLIDFGYAKKYIDEHGQIYNMNAEVDIFEGNILFSSVNHLDFKVT